MVSAVRDSLPQRRPKPSLSGSSFASWYEGAIGSLQKFPGDANGSGESEGPGCTMHPRGADGPGDPKGRGDKRSPEDAKDHEDNKGCGGPKGPGDTIDPTDTRGPGETRDPGDAIDPGGTIWFVLMDPATVSLWTRPSDSTPINLRVCLQPRRDLVDLLAGSTNRCLLREPVVSSVRPADGRFWVLSRSSVGVMPSGGTCFLWRQMRRWLLMAVLQMTT